MMAPPQDILTVPTSIQWRNPYGTLPRMAVLRAVGVDEDGRVGDVVTRSAFLGAAPGTMVVSLVMEPGAFFDPDTGIYAVGNGMLRQEEEAVRHFPTDAKWWKYPGNYQFRGKEWERAGNMEVFGAAGELLCNVPVRTRIHGNNTRGFAQHALRLSFLRPLPVDLLGTSGGQQALLLRAGGNDQNKAFMRDLLQHRLCASAPFETMHGRPVLVHVNGVFWGWHHLRERLDEHELARRHGVDHKGFTILEDRAVLYRGKVSEVKAFERIITRAERMDPTGPAYLDSIGRYLDLGNTSAYLAAQVFLGNADWPDQNVRYFRWTAAPIPGDPALNGKWHFMMGDSDMGYGYVLSADHDLFAQMARSRAPVPRLFTALLRSPAFLEQVVRDMEAMMQGPFSTPAMLQEVDRLEQEMEGAMALHCQRWRRPSSVPVWKRHVEDLRAFARRRPVAMEQQLKELRTRVLPPA